MRRRPLNLSGTIALALTVAVIAACRAGTVSPEAIYVVDAKPVPSIASSAYAAYPEFKAMAVNADGTAFLSIRQCSAAKATEDALDDCRRSSTGQACRVAAIGNADASGLDESGVRSSSGSIPAPSPSCAAAARTRGRRYPSF